MMTTEVDMPQSLKQNLAMMSERAVLQQVYHFKIDVIAGDANSAAYKVVQKARAPRSARFLSCRHAKRDAT